MQASIAQIIALVTWGNAVLKGRVVDEVSFYPSNSTFTFCESVRFCDLGRVGEKSIYAADPTAWFKRLRQEGVSALRMVYRPSQNMEAMRHGLSDRISVAFVGGGGRWLMEAAKPTGYDDWQARWQVGECGREDQRIWRVTYGRIAVDAPPLQQQRVDAEEMKAQLTETLSKIARFAREHQLQGFEMAFVAAIARLNSPNPLEGFYHADLAPQNFLPEISLQLLAAAQAAWVFGGMGSWNDMAFEGQDEVEYNALSEELYQGLNAAIVVAANSSSQTLP